MWWMMTDKIVNLLMKYKEKRKYKKFVFHKSSSTTTEIKRWQNA